MGELGRLRERAWEISKELEQAEEAETMRKGCRVCGGEIGTGIYRRTVTVAGQPFSEGSMSETFIVCSGCQEKVLAIFNKPLRGE